MLNQFSRTQLLLGREAMEKLVRPKEDMSISCRTHCICPLGAQHKCTERRDIPGSTAFVPAVAGLMIAGEVVRNLTKAGSRKK